MISEHQQILITVVVITMLVCVSFVRSCDSYRRAEYVNASREVCRQYHDCDDLRKRLAND